MGITKIIRIDEKDVVFKAMEQTADKQSKSFD